jgi:hypothetical protein
MVIKKIVLHETMELYFGNALAAMRVYGEQIPRRR